MSERYDHVLNLLREHKTLLEYIANTLLEKETMEAKEFNDIINAETHCKELENSAADDGETPKTDDSVVDSE